MSLFKAFDIKNTILEKELEIDKMRDEIDKVKSSLPDIYHQDDKIDLRSRIGKASKYKNIHLPMYDKWKHNPNVKLYRDADGIVKPLQYLYKKNYHLDNKDKLKPITIEKYHLLEEHEKALWTPDFKREIRIEQDIKCYVHRNFFDIRYTCFDNVSGDRSSKILDSLIFLSSGIIPIFEYRGKFTESNHHKRTSFKQILNRWFSVFCYEFNSCFKGNIGYSLMQYFKKNSSRTYETGCYLTSEKTKKDNIVISFYNVSAKEENRLINKRDDIYKLEVSISGDKAIRDAREYKEHDAIVDMYKLQLEKEIKNKFYNCLDKENKMILRRELQETDKNIINGFLLPDRSKYLVIDKVNKLESSINIMQSDIDNMKYEIKAIEKRLDKAGI